MELNLRFQNSEWHKKKNGNFKLTSIIWVALTFKQP